MEQQPYEDEICTSEELFIFCKESIKGLQMIISLNAFVKTKDFGASPGLHMLLLSNVFVSMCLCTIPGLWPTENM